LLRRVQSNPMLEPEVLDQMPPMTCIGQSKQQAKECPLGCR
jgi:hypothetical protein